MSGVTMSQVAAAAGVSVSTVSHVVNGTRPVRPETRSRVLRLIEELGFTHQPVSRSLASGSTRTIGLVVASMRNPYWIEIIDGFQAEAKRQGLELLIVDTDENPEEEYRVVANLLAHHVVGLVVAPSTGWEERAWRLVSDRAVPVVLLDRIMPLPLDQVGVENLSAAQALVSHLLDLGHRRIALLSGVDGLSTTTERLAGYQRAHLRAGVEVDESLCVAGRSSEDGGFRAARRLLARPNPPTALFGANLAMTFGAMRAIRDAGLRVPDDIAVVTFDDLPWFDLFEPSLTSVAQPAFAIGARAIQLLVRRMENERVPHQVLRLGAEIVHRSSCGCSEGAAHADPL